MTDIENLSVLSSMADTGLILGAESPNAPFPALYSPAAIVPNMGLPQNVSSMANLRGVNPVEGRFANLLSYYPNSNDGGGIFFGARQATFTGTISGSGVNPYTLTIAAGTLSKVLYPGMILSATGLGANIYILTQVSGQPGGEGTYAVSTGAANLSNASFTAKFVDDGGLIIVPAGGDGSTAWVRSLTSTAMLFAEYWGVKANFTDDDSGPAQSAINSMLQFGGHLVFPKGRCRFANQVTINRYPNYFPLPPKFGPTYPASGGAPVSFFGERVLIISGYGCEIHTTGAISGFEIGPQSSYSQLTIKGFCFYHLGNTTATAGIRSYGTHNLSIENNHFLVSSSLPATYAAIKLETITPANEDGSILTNIINNTFSNTGSQDGSAPYNIALYGAQNGVVIAGNTFSAANTHILLSNYPGYDYSPNTTVIDNNRFEGPALGTCIVLNNDGMSAGRPYHVAGTRITNNRIEVTKTFLSLTGNDISPTQVTPIVPTFLAGNAGIVSVPNYLINPYNIIVNSLDTTITGMQTGPTRMFNNFGYDFSAQTPSPVTFTATIAGDIMTVTASTGGIIVAGLVITSGAAANTYIISQETSDEVGGGWFGKGTYKVSVSQTVTSSTSMTAGYPPAFTIRFARLDYGLSFKRTDNNRNVELANFTWKDIGTNSIVRTQMMFTGNTYQLGFMNVGSISSSATIPARNFHGYVDFAAQSSASISFGASQEEFNTNYQVIIDAPWNTFAYVTSKSTTGFTINTSASGTGRVWWTIIR